MKSKKAHLNQDLGEKYVDPQTIADFYGFTRYTVYDWIKEPSFPCVRLARNYRMRLSEVQEWLLNVYPKLTLQKPHIP